MVKEKSEIFNCSLCGYRFDPAQHPGCGSCPLHSGCQLVCCPSCGHTNINPQESKLARWVSGMIGVKNPHGN